MPVRDPEDLRPPAVDRTRRRLLGVTAAGAAVGGGCLAGQFPDASGRAAELDASPTTTPQEEHAGPPAEPVATVDYRLDEPRLVSAAVYDAEGRLVRTLLRADRQEEGEHTVGWDGLDRHGEPQPPGEYTVKLLHKPPFEAEFVTQVGVSPDSQPYHRWVGNHHGAASVATDDSGMYVATTNAEGPPTLLKQSLDGTDRLWVQGGSVVRGAWQGGVALASDGEGTLYLLQQNGFLQPIDAETGEVRAPTHKHRNRETWDPLPDAERTDDGGRPSRAYTHDATAEGGVAGADIAAGGDTLVISFRDRDSVRWLSTDDGSVEAAVDVPSPTGVAVDARGGVFVISNGAVVQVSKNGGTRPVIETDLATPRRLDIDHDTGDVVVAEGPPDNRVKRFSRDGTLERTLGREGGRQEGPYRPGHFLGVTDVATAGGPNGGFLVAEPHVAPRRVAHVDADGEVVDEWFGGQGFFSWKSIDPRSPTQVWFGSGGWVVRAEVDYENGDWEVLETHDLGAKDLVHGKMGASDAWRVRYHDGERYLVSESFPQVLHHAGDRLRPSVVYRRSGRLGPYQKSGEIQPADIPDRLLTLAELKGAEDPAQWAWDRFGSTRPEFNAYLWTDANGDHTPQGDEIEFAKIGNIYAGPGGGVSVADDFSVLMAGAVQHDDGAFTSHLYRLAPDGWEDGVPQYSLPDEPWGMEPITEIDMLGVGDGRVRCRSTFEDGDGDLYGFYMWGPDHYGAWPTSNYGGRNRLTKWDANGNVRWSVGRHVAGRAGVNTDLNTEAPRGQLHDPSTIDGEVRDTIVVADRVEHTGMVYTKDGLYAGYLMEERADDGLPDRVYEWWWDLDADRSALLGHDCAQGGDIVEHDGEVYWFSPSSQGSVVYRIRGWDAWTRAETTVGIDDRPSHASGEGSGLAGAYHASADLSGPAAEQVDDRVWFGQTGEDTSNVLDGRPPATDWSKGVGPLDDPDAFGVRWTGEIEPELTEAYAFSTYARGGVRLWIGGEQVIHGWNESHWQREGPPVALVAGERYPVRLDYYTTSDRPAVSLNWEAFSRERERVPTAHLYPDAAVDPAAWQVGARDATARIPAESFDTTNVETPEFDTFSWKTCRCFLRGFDGEGTYLGYRRLDFGDGVSQFRTDMGGNADHEVAIRVDAPDGRTIGTGTTAGDGVTAIDVDTATGVHDCYLVTTAGGSGVRWFTFDA